MNEPQKAYSRRQLISVAEVANALALESDIAGLEAIQQLAEFAHQGKLCADLYPPHQYWQHGGQSDLIGKPADNSVQVWRSLSSKSVERHMSDKDDFNYPPAASTYHLLADDVFALLKRMPEPKSCQGNARLSRTPQGRVGIRPGQRTASNRSTSAADRVAAASACLSRAPASPTTGRTARAGDGRQCQQCAEQWQGVDTGKAGRVESLFDKQGTKKAAEHFGISGARIRQLLPSDKPKQKGYSAFTHR